jgi:hypothetical protein
LLIAVRAPVRTLPNLAAQDARCGSLRGLRDSYLIRRVDVTAF